MNKITSIKNKIILILTRRIYQPPPNTPPEISTTTLPTIGIRLLVSVLTGMWFAFFPIYLFVIYMLHEKFFSYDFFSDGVFGLKTFFFVLLIVLMALSFHLWGFLFLFKKACIEYSKPQPNKYNKYWWWTYSMLIVSCGFHLLLLFAGTRENQGIRLISFSLLGFLFISIACSFVGGNTFKKMTDWKPPIFLIFISATIPAFNTEITADLISTALLGFNVGGGVHAKVFSTEHPEKVIHEGKLLLLTPNNAYFRDGKQSYRIIKQNEIFTISIGKSDNKEK
ncbi:MAG: hypothetical protein RL748_114 [Pseudomonadota bacterium]|jgi:hypothetical protein